MKYETFKAVLASSMFVTLVLSSLAGVALSVHSGDNLFALSFACNTIQIVWMVILTFKNEPTSGRGD